MSGSNSTTSLSSPISSSIPSTSLPSSTTPSSLSSSASSSFSSSSTIPSTSIPPTTSASLIVSTSLVTATAPSTATLPNGAVTTVFTTSTNVVTQTQSNTQGSTSGTAAAASTGANSLGTPSGQSSAGSNSKTIALATVIPIVAVILLVLAALWFWRKRKERKNAEEMRRKEMEEYGFNPNNDPVLATVGSTNGDEPSTMRERDAGYRGWGTTTTSNTRKASTTMSSNPGMARSDSGGRGHNDPTSPTGGAAHAPDGNSGDALVANGGADDLAALGAAPSASGNRGAGVHRGPSNASSAYSGANYSDVSGEGPLPNGSPQDYGGYMHPDEQVGTAHFADSGWAAQPIIKDVSARRNTRIENPAIVPHQGGIAQNF